MSRRRVVSLQFAINLWFSVHSCTKKETPPEFFSIMYGSSQVWSTNRCVLSTIFSTFNMNRWTDQQAYFPVEMQFYISVMFLGFPDKIHEEKPSFLDFENNWLRTDRPTDGPTYRPTDRRTDRPSYRDARTHLKTIGAV